MSKTAHKRREESDEVAPRHEFHRRKKIDAKKIEEDDPIALGFDDEKEFEEYARYIK